MAKQIATKIVVDHVEAAPEVSEIVNRQKAEADHDIAAGTVTLRWGREQIAVVKRSAAPLAEYARDVGEEPLILTRAGKPLAALVSIANADWETLSLSTNADFLNLIEQARARQAVEGGISSDEMRRRLSSAPTPARGKLWQGTRVVHSQRRLVWRPPTTFWIRRARAGSVGRPEATGAELPDGLPERG